MYSSKEQEKQVPAVGFVNLGPKAVSRQLCFPALGFVRFFFFKMGFCLFFGCSR